jgi:hypothetical protein
MFDWRRHAAQCLTRATLVAVLLLALAGLTPLGKANLASAAPPKAGKADVFPADNVWNRTVTDLPVHALSSTYLNTIGLNSHFHADFGSGTWDGGPIGIPYVIVPGTQPKVPIHFTAYGDQSDPGPMPIPASAPIEGGADSDGDRHVLVIDEDNAVLYELYRAFPNDDGSWNADSAAIWPLNSNATRPDTWTSADAAGLPIFSGLARYDEVATGAIHHALRFTVPRTQTEHIWPARHDAGDSGNSALPPMGLRLRLKANVDLSHYQPQARVVLQALKDYGMILTDNGSAVYLSGAPDERWNNDDLHSMDSVTASMLEVVDESGAMVDPNTAQAKQPGSGTQPSPSPSPHPSPSVPASPTPGQKTLTVSKVGSGTVTPGNGTYASAATVNLTATPASGWIFASWKVDGLVAGFTPQLALWMNTDHPVVATFVRPHSYPDVPSGSVASTAITQLSAAEIIHGYSDGTFGPNDPTLRAQMAALIARAMGWDTEDHGNGFSDQGTVDPTLWRNVGTLAYYDVARGYGDGTFDPTSSVLAVQTVSFISRAMVGRGWWVEQPDNPALYPTVPASSGARIDLATYVHYAGQLPETSSPTATWPGWNQPATRAWFARALWAALSGLTSAP